MAAHGARTAPSRRRAGIALLASLALLAVGPRPLTGSGQAALPSSDSADRLIFWTKCKQVVELTDAQLDQWKANGVDGFTCQVGRLRGLGGSQDFTGNPAASLAGSNYSLQRSLRDSDIVDRAAARGMKLYLGVYFSNQYNTATPLAEWFDNARWTKNVLPKLTDLAAAAKLLGFAGIAIDQELYQAGGGARTATWNWNYPGNKRDETAVRAQVTKRGQEVMSAILQGFPGAELAVYSWIWPETWRELVMREEYGTVDAFAKNANWNFWDGMTRVEGYGALHFYDSIFYKMPHRGTWDAAMQYNANRTLAFLSRSFSNWDYASSRVSISPFSWIDPGPSATKWDDAGPPARVREQLLAMRKWGMGGEFANYAYGSLSGFDYGPYADAMRSGSSPGSVDGTDPTLAITAVSSSRGIEGTARDNLAIRAVRWHDDLGGSGTVPLRWHVLSGDYNSGYKWETLWSLPPSALTPGATGVTITAEDLKGHTSAPTQLVLAPGAVGVASSPQVVIVTKPGKRLKVRHSRARLQFELASSAERPIGFSCRLDKRRWHRCDSGSAGYRVKTRRRWTKHTFQASATDLGGHAVGPPTSYRFRIRRRADR